MVFVLLCVKAELEFFTRTNIEIWSALEFDISNPLL